MSVKITLREQQYEIRAGMTLRHALLKLNIQPQTVLPTRADELITDEEILRDGDEIRLIAVIYGG